MRKAPSCWTVMLCFSFSIFCLWSTSLDLLGNYLWRDGCGGHNQTPRAESKPDQQVKICPQAWKFYNEETDRAYLEDLYRKLYAYHNLGGNMESLQAFLDEAIDYTYDKVGLTPFVLDSSKEDVNASKNIDSVQQQIRNELARQDVDNRGGYYQRKLPGSFQGTAIKSKHYSNKAEMDTRFLTVLQPVSTMRWDIAMGHPNQTLKHCQGFHELQGPPNRRYETKYICGWDHLSSTKKYSNITASKASTKENKESSAHSNCNIVSIGSNDQWGFENQIIKHTDCNIATFDCTVRNPKHKPRTDQVKFYSQCITGGQEEKVINGRSFGTYFDLLEKAGMAEASRINYLKLDVEGYEYDVLTSMIRQAYEQNMWHLLPEQMQIEFHYATWMYDLPWSLRTRETGELVAFFSMLFREAGYVVVHVENVFSTIRELLLLKIYC